jgi:hypothetical protein
MSQRSIGLLSVEAFFHPPIGLPAVGAAIAERLKAGRAPQRRTQPDSAQLPLCPSPGTHLQVSEVWTVRRYVLMQETSDINHDLPHIPSPLNLAGQVGIDSI